MGRLSKFLREFWPRIVSGMLASILASLVLTFVLGDPKGSVVSSLSSILGSWFVPASPGTHLTILVFDLEEDGRGNHKRHLVGTLDDLFHVKSPESAVRVLSIPTVLSERQSGDVAAAHARLLADGRSMLEQKNADIGIFGRVAESDEVQLRFMTRSAATKDMQFRVSEARKLPAAFGTQLADALAAEIVASARPANSSTQERIAGRVLAPLVQKLATFLARPVSVFSNEQVASIKYSYATGELRLGLELAEKDRLKRAISTYRDVASSWQRAADPAKWAEVQNRLGTALTSLGDLSSDDEGLK